MCNSVIGIVLIQNALRMCARLDRDAWRILVYRNRQHAEVTARGDALETASPLRDYEISSYGISVYIECCRRVADNIPIEGNGSGPDGSSLTSYY